MKLQRQAAYEYKGKKKHKFVVVIPEQIVSEIGWKAGENLKFRIEANSVILSSVSSAKNSQKVNKTKE